MRLNLTKNRESTHPRSMRAQWARQRRCRCFQAKELTDVAAQCKSHTDFPPPRKSWPSMQSVPLVLHNTADAWDGNSCLREQKVNRFMNVFASVASVASSSKSWEAIATVPSVSIMTPVSGCSLEPYFLGSRISSLLSWSTSNGVILLWPLVWRHEYENCVRCICYYPEQSHFRVPPGVFIEVNG